MSRRYMVSLLCAVYFPYYIRINKFNIVKLVLDITATLFEPSVLQCLMVNWVSNGQYNTSDNTI